MIRRSANVAILPLKVCFPGGGALAGESIESACVREGLEELGVIVNPIKQVWRHDFLDRPMTLFGFLAELGAGPLQPEPAEIAEVLWLSQTEALTRPDGVATNAGFLAALEAAWHNT